MFYKIVKTGFRFHTQGPKVKPIVLKLVDALSTPSQAVQEAVASCLPHLVPAIKADAPKIITKMLQTLLHSEKVCFSEEKNRKIF